ncbi:MAG TPA: hypothetical protein VM531_11260 [Sphingomicrobium sp.]|nr:hypothetical protein [Sphingomicrobium sp.]
MSDGTLSAYPWWIVVGHHPNRGHLAPERVNAQTHEMAKADFERRFPGAAVVSVAQEVYRNDDYKL